MTELLAPLLDLQFLGFGFGNQFGRCPEGGTFNILDTWMGANSWKKNILLQLGVICGVYSGVYN